VPKGVGRKISRRGTTEKKIKNIKKYQKIALYASSGWEGGGNG